MLLSLWLMSQFVLITLLVALGSAQPQSPAQLALVGAVGLLVAAPIIIRIGWTRRVPALPAALAAPTPSRTGAPLSYALPTTPGTPGTPLSRAPALVVIALNAPKPERSEA